MNHARQVSPAAVLPSLPRIEGETVNQWVYRSLRHAVMVGLVPPGRALTIRGIAASFAVSTMPVREALRRLSAENALAVQGNRRVQVPQMTAARFQELCALRIALETHAAARALPFVDDRRLTRLIALDGETEAAERAGDTVAVTMLNQDFHRTLYLSNPHQVTLPAIESTWLQLGPFMALALSRSREFYPVDRHREALAALHKKDAEALKAAIAADVEDGVSRVGTSELLAAYVNRGAS